MKVPECLRISEGMFVCVCYSLSRSICRLTISLFSVQPPRSWNVRYFTSVPKEHHSERRLHERPRPRRMQIIRVFIAQTLQRKGASPSKCSLYRVVVVVSVAIFRRTPDQPLPLSWSLRCSLACLLVCQRHLLSCPCPFFLKSYYYCYHRYYYSIPISSPSSSSFSSTSSTLPLFLSLVFFSPPPITPPYSSFPSRKRHGL